MSLQVSNINNLSFTSMQLLSSTYKGKDVSLSTIDKCKIVGLIIGGLILLPIGVGAFCLADGFDYWLRLLP